MSQSTDDRNVRSENFTENFSSFPGDRSVVDMSEQIDNYIDIRDNLHNISVQME